MPDSASLLTGVSAGVGLCVGPIYISEIAPSSIRGAVGQYILCLLALSC